LRVLLLYHFILLIDNSIFSYLGYLILFVLFVFSFQRWQKYKLGKIESSQPIDQLEHNVPKKIKELEKEKTDLEKELRSTKIKLVIKSKELEDKKKVIQNLGDKLYKLQNTDSISKMSWKEIFRIIESHQDIRSNTFQIHMDELNQLFTQKLKADCPALTMYDLRLCTYIKTGLSTREIAEMMQVLPSSINVSRSRLRKKLGLEAKDDLFSFLEAV